MQPSGCNLPVMRGLKAKAVATAAVSAALAGVVHAAWGVNTGAPCARKHTHKGNEVSTHMPPAPIKAPLITGYGCPAVLGLAPPAGACAAAVREQTAQCFTHRNETAHGRHTNTKQINNPHSPTIGAGLAAGGAAREVRDCPASLGTSAAEEFDLSSSWISLSMSCTS